jgi:anti-sigma B factor antagonist
MSSGTLTMRVRREPGGIAVITVTGEVNIATVAGLRDRLFRLADTSRSVIVELDQVSFTDAAGLGALVGAAHRADIHGASLQVVCDRPQTWELFRLAGLDRRLGLARTRAEALQALRTTRRGLPLPSERTARRGAPPLKLLSPIYLDRRSRGSGLLPGRDQDCLAGWLRCSSAAMVWLSSCQLFSNLARPSRSSCSVTSSKSTPTVAS